jgi:hypothetical protein
MTIRLLGYRADALQQCAIKLDYYIMLPSLKVDNNFVTHRIQEE